MVLQYVLACASEGRRVLLPLWAWGERHHSGVVAIPAEHISHVALLRKAVWQLLELSHALRHAYRQLPVQKLRVAKLLRR